jgi:hypothetical protein
VIVVGSDRRLAFSVPITLARQSSFPVIIVPLGGGFGMMRYFEPVARP